MVNLLPQNAEIINIKIKSPAKDLGCHGTKKIQTNHSRYQMENW